MDTVLRKQTISNFRVPPEDANSKFVWNTATQTTCYPDLHHIMFIRYCEKLNYKYHIMFWTNTDVGCCTLHHICITVSTASSNETRKQKKITKLKAASHSEMQNVTSSTYTDGFTVNTTIQDTCKSQKKKRKNMTTTFTTEHDKF